MMPLGNKDFHEMKALFGQIEQSEGLNRYRKRRNIKGAII